MLHLVLQYQQTNQNGEIIFGGESQITITGISQGVKINSQTRVAIIEQKSKNLSWKTVWNYNEVSGRERAGSKGDPGTGLVSVF